MSQKTPVLLLTAECLGTELEKLLSSGVAGEGQPYIPDEESMAGLDPSINILSCDPVNCSLQYLDVHRQSSGCPRRTYGTFGTNPESLP